MNFFNNSAISASNQYLKDFEKLNEGNNFTTYQKSNIANNFAPILKNKFLHTKY